MTVALAEGDSGILGEVEDSLPFHSCTGSAMGREAIVVDTS